MEIRYKMPQKNAANINHLKTVKIMKTEQFTFTGIGWLLNGYDDGDRLRNLTRGLRFLEKFGTNWQFITDSTGTRLEISGYDDVLDNRLADGPVTFLKKYRYTEKSNNELALDTDLMADDDRLIIVTIDDDMILTVKQLFWDGEIMEMNY